MKVFKSIYISNVPYTRLCSCFLGTNDSYWHVMLILGQSLNSSEAPYGVPVQQLVVIIFL